MAAGLDNTLRVGLVGTGRIGVMHAELLAHRVPGAALVAVADANPALAKQVSASLGVSVRDPEAIVCGDDVDVVAICSSTDTHASFVLDAAAAGKAVFCEKPISLDLGELQDVASRIEAAGVPFMIGFNRRFDPAHRAVREAVASGRIGELHLLRVTSRDPEPPPLDYFRVSGGIFFDMTVHDFDMARYVSGSEVVDVFARGLARVDPALSELGEVDTAVITMVHENDCLTVIDNSTCAVYGYDQRVEAFGSAGSASSENQNEATVIYQSSGGSSEPPLKRFFLERYWESYRAEWCAFVDAIGAGSHAGTIPDHRSVIDGELSTHPGTAPVTPGGGDIPGIDDARAALLIGLAAKRSLQESRPVKPGELGLG